MRPISQAIAAGERARDRARETVRSGATRAFAVRTAPTRTGATDGETARR